MKKDMHERLAAFYGGDIPGYILNAGKEVCDEDLHNMQ
jgi:hypothetical protein